MMYLMPVETHVTASFQHMHTRVSVLACGVQTSTTLDFREANDFPGHRFIAINTTAAQLRRELWWTLTNQHDD